MFSFSEGSADKMAYTIHYLKTKYTYDNKENKFFRNSFFFIAKVRQMFSSSEGSADKMAYTIQLLNDMRYQ